MKKQRYRFLTESVLLEETGLPNINNIIIIGVTLLLFLFLVWASILNIDETLSVKGYVLDYRDDYHLVVRIPSKDISLVKEDLFAEVSIPGITYRQTISAEVVEINTSAKDINGSIYYEALLSFSKDDYSKYELSDSLLEGMESNVKLITGQKSLLQYLLGNLYETSKSL